MSRRFMAICLSIVAFCNASLIWAGGIEQPPEANAQVINSLREEGPAALEKLFQMREEVGLKQKPDPVALERINALIDAVGGAKYCTASRLFWYTDFEQAQAAAKSSGKPILSLRMLGNLTDDFSCANSRFFRTTLYANTEISQLLRDKFVLHWKSVRPVPKITIDFGEGRKIERTITGNSIHYILLPDGTVVDGLPGLYGPQAFKHRLMIAAETAVEAMKKEANLQREYLVKYHEREATAIVTAWENDLKMLSIPSAPDIKPAAAVQAAPPPAIAAARIARPKSLAELPMIKAIAATNVKQLQARTTEELWEQIAALHAEEAKLDIASRQLIAAQNPTATVAAKLAITKARTENPLVRMFRSLEQAVAIDSVRNEYELHRQLHQWLAGKESMTVVDTLNERVYAELFLTPSSDPWLGLIPSDAYSALPNNGLVSNPPSK